MNTTDFIYTCDTHLKDPGFASEVKESKEAPQIPALSAEEIAKVKKEWEEEQRKKQEAKKAKEKDKDKADTSQEGKGEEKKSKTSGGSSPVPLIIPTPPTPSHQRYTLHRDYFAMRLAAHRRQRQASQAKELAPRLPGAPRGVLGSS